MSRRPCAKSKSKCKTGNRFRLQLYCISYGITKCAGGTRKEARLGVCGIASTAIHAGEKTESGRSARYCVPYGIIECKAVVGDEKTENGRRVRYCVPYGIVKCAGGRYLEKEARTSPCGNHYPLDHYASPSTSQQHSTSFHQISQSSESWGCANIHLILSTLIILVVAIIKNIHPSFHIPHPTQSQLASRKKIHRVRQ